MNSPSNFTGKKKLEEWTYGAQSFDETDDQNGNVTDIGSHGRQKSKQYIDKDGSPDDPFRWKHFGHSSARNLGYNVAPKIRAKYQSLDRFRPCKRAILRL